MDYHFVITIMSLLRSSFFAHLSLSFAYLIARAFFFLKFLRVGIAWPQLLSCADFLFSKVLEEKC